MSFIIDQPIWLFAILFGLASAILGWRILRGLPPSRRFVVVAARCAMFTSLAMALAGLQQVTTTDRLTVVAVVDVSGSVQGFANLGTDDTGYPLNIGTVAQHFIAQGSKNRQDNDLLAMVAFDGQVHVISPPRPKHRQDDLTFEVQQADGTDLPSAIRQAQALIAGDSRGRIILISDGVSTAGSLDQLTFTSPVDVVPINYQVKQEVLVESVEVPARVVANSLMPVVVTMRSTGPAKGSLRIIVDGQVIDLNPNHPSTGLALSLKGGIEPITITVPIAQGRVHRVRAIWEPTQNADGSMIGDTNTLNNESSALTLTSDHGRVMVVTNNPDQEAQALTSVLEATGWTIDTISPPEAPASMLGFEPYDLIIFINTPRDALVQGIEAALDEYVRSLGGGLLFIGGYEALGAGGWNASLDEGQGQGLVANLLPVNLEIPDDVVTTHAAVVLVLDSSGSMQRPVMGSSRSQQMVANNSASGAIEVLDPTDMVSVVSFSGSPRLVVPITKNDNPESTRRKIKTITSGGGTNLGPALTMAGNQLRGVESKTKHIVVLSDGESQNPETLPEMAKKLGEEGIRISTITIGDQADIQTMRQIAVQSGGVFYRVVNPSVLPRIFLKAVRVLRRPMIREEIITPVIVEPTSPMLPATGLTSLPPLSGLVMTEHKSDDPRVMVPIVSQKGEPILAGHQVELGRVAVFTSDVSSWTSQWIDSDGFDAFWTHLAQWSARSKDPGIGELSIAHVSNQLKLDYTAIDEQGLPIDGLNLTTKVFAPNGTTRFIDMIQTGPGHYQGQLTSVQPGDQVITVTPTKEGQRLRPTIGAIHVQSQTEFNTLESNPKALSSIAQRSGGRILSLTQPADLFSREGLQKASSYESKWWLLIVLGLVLFMLDLGARRVAWDRWLAQARAETIAVSRAVDAASIANLGQRIKSSEPSIHIESEPVRRQYHQPTQTTKEADDAEVEELSSLMAAKRRARDRMDNE